MLSSRQGVIPDRRCAVYGESASKENFFCMNQWDSGTDGKVRMREDEYFQNVCALDGFIFGHFLII